MDPILPDSKACTKCLVEKPLDDFHKRSASKDGHQPSCRDCGKLYDRLHFQKNIEAITAKRKIYYQENVEVFTLKNAAYYAENRDQELAYAKKYRAENRHKFAEASRRYRSRKLENGMEYYTEAQVLELYGTDCHICSLPIDLDAPRSAWYEGWEMGLQVDHIQPISKQGPDTLSNVRPSHGVCNNKKKATWDDPA